MHRDHVPSLPPSFASLGSTKDCNIHGMVKKVDENLPLTPDNVGIITLQGEFDFLKRRDSQRPQVQKLPFDAMERDAGRREAVRWL